MTNVIEKISSSRDMCTDLVFEFFNGKYSRDEVYSNLYDECTINGAIVRLGVLKLKDEFQKVAAGNDHASVDNWYKTTDFYVFDLLPWNGCSMFAEKVQAVSDVIRKSKISSVVDFGGGLGVSSMFLKDAFPNLKIVYCDFLESTTAKFAGFLFKKWNYDIPMVDTNEFLANDDLVDMVYAGDVLEHVTNLENFFKQLYRKQIPIIYHQSTFFTDAFSPQHINVDVPKIYSRAGSCGWIFQTPNLFVRGSFTASIVNGHIELGVVSEASSIL